MGLQMQHFQMVVAAAEYTSKHLVRVHDDGAPNMFLLHASGPKFRAMQSKQKERAHSEQVATLSLPASLPASVLQSTSET